MVKQTKFVNRFKDRITKLSKEKKEVTKMKIEAGVIPEEEVEEIIEEEEKSPELKIEGISKDRKCKIDFSEPLYSPFDQDGEGANIRRRMMLEVEDFDITT